PKLPSHDSAAWVRCSAVSVTRISFSASAKVPAVSGGPASAVAAPGVPEKIEAEPEGGATPASGAAAASLLPATATPASATAPAATATASAPSARKRLRLFRSAIVLAFRLPPHAPGARTSEQTDAEMNRKDGLIQRIVGGEVEAHVERQGTHRGDVANAGPGGGTELEGLPGPGGVPEVPRLEEQSHVEVAPCRAAR